MRLVEDVTFIYYTQAATSQWSYLEAGMNEIQQGNRKSLEEAESL